LTLRHYISIICHFAALRLHYSLTPLIAIFAITRIITPLFSLLLLRHAAIAAAIVEIDAYAPFRAPLYAISTLLLPPYLPLLFRAMPPLAAAISPPPPPRHARHYYFFAAITPCHYYFHYYYFVTPLFRLPPPPLLSFSPHDIAFDAAAAASAIRLYTPLLCCRHLLTRRQRITFAATLRRRFYAS
jgi:hypothetical protein